MQIKELLSPEATFVSDQDDTQKQIFERLSECLCLQQSNLNQAKVFEALLERERLGNTGIGHGVAIPHIRSSEVNHPIAALLHIKQGIDLDGSDDIPVDLFFALIVPEGSNIKHLEILASLAKRFSKQNYLRDLRNAKDNHSLFQAAISSDE